jgi:hypothetical protein
MWVSNFAGSESGKICAYAMVQGGRKLEIMPLIIFRSKFKEKITVL